MAAWNVCTMLKFRPFGTFFRTPVLFRKEDDKVTGVLLKLNRPKKPPSAFLRFLGKCRKELEAKYPEKPCTEINKLASKLWRDVSETEKSKYTLAYAMELEEYMTQKNNFQQELELYKYKNEWMRGSKKITAADKRIMGKPDKPRLNFLLFRSFLKNSFPGLKSEELLEKARAKWKSNEDKDKKKFVEEFSEAVKKYHQDLLEWEENMYNKGYSQLVRSSSLEKFRKLE